MTTRSATTARRPGCPQLGRAWASHLAPLVLLTGLLAILWGSSLAGAPAPSLVLERIETVGATRTSDATVALYFPLRPGDPVDQQAILAAVAELRRSGLFESVDFYTRPGSVRGRVVVVLEVEEKGVDFRLGTGNTDLDGWYLIPAQVALDNQLGRGERLDLRLEFGYRRTGLELTFAEPRLGDGRSYWGFRTGIVGTDRIWFFRDTEYRQHVETGSTEVHLGRRFTRLWSTEVGVRWERVEADSTATVHVDDAAHGLERGDELPFDELPADVARGVGRRDRSVAHVDLVLDSRGSGWVAGSPASGLWGRLRGEAYLQGDESFGALNLDLRVYQAWLGGGLALRLRGSLVGDAAPFYDRLYLGGLYTVRGFPSQSLSAPGGDTWLWSASCEYRAPLIGDRAAPRLAGVLFIDAGDSGRGTRPVWRDIAVGAGWGLRLRVAWLGWLGLDFGVPLSDSPVDDSFHAHASIGWTF
jgi:outer membrane protein assembly factor BamA